MNAERWRRVEELFYAALDRAPAERDAFVETACGDPELAREVRSLLAAGHESGRVGGLVAEGIAAAGLGSQAQDPEALSVPDDEAPERLGPYRVVREIGRGGLGTVYLAERDDEHYSMRVAIKRVRRGLDTDDILERLRRERQILARLEHPHITRLLDGGSTEDGRPYLVMEYVEGTTLDVFAERHGLSVRRRVELVLDVCAAVIFAHRNLVIHRDIKPSNVLVTEEGIVKLLDFGIAQLLEPGSEAEPTAPEKRLLTPEYAGPEQLRGLPLSTATDVYSLGALLYRLLTGAPPFDRRHRADPEILPPRPSDRIAGDRVAGDRVAGDARRRRRLRGDLDNIVLRAMAVDPRDRYGSVAELAEDLRNHLEDRPVRARPPSLALRGWKLVRRHRLGALAVALVVASLVVGAAATYWQAQKARRAQSEAERVSAFLTELVEAAKPEVSRGEAVTVRSMLDRGAERIAREPSAEPEVQARLMTTMGRAYLSLGVYDRAEDLHRGALEIRRGLWGEGHPSWAESAEAVAEVLLFTGDLDEAERLLLEALAVRRDRLGPESLDAASALTNLGVLYRRSHRLPEGESALREALGIRRRHLGDHHADTAEALHNLGVVLTESGRFADGELRLRQAVDTRRALLGADHPATVASLGSLARALRLQGHLDEAETHLEAVLTASRRLFGERHREVAVPLNGLAKISLARGEPERAAERYGEAMGILAESLGADHRSVAVTSTNRGRALVDAGQPEAAEEAFRRALRVHEPLGDHPERARTLELLGSLLCDSARADEGESLLLRAREIRRRLHGESDRDRWQIAAVELRLGACLLDAGRSAEAEPLLRRAHAEMLRRFGADHRRTREAEALLSRLVGDARLVGDESVTG